VKVIILIAAVVVVVVAVPSLLLYNHAQATVLTYARLRRAFTLSTVFRSLCQWKMSLVTTSYCWCSDQPLDVYLNINVNDISSISETKMVSAEWNCITHAEFIKCSSALPDSRLPLRAAPSPDF